MTDCIFCKIIAGEIPSRKVFENEFSIAILDIYPRNPGHTIVFPKDHSQDFFSISEGSAVELIKTVRKVAVAIQKATGVKGISLVSSNGLTAGQRMPHAHFHVIPRTEAEKTFGLEEVLPVKKQKDDELDAMAGKISKSIPQAHKESPSEPAREEVKEESAKDTNPPSEERGTDTPKGTGKPKKPEEQDIDFDF